LRRYGLLFNKASYVRLLEFAHDLLAGNPLSDISTGINVSSPSHAKVRRPRGRQPAHAMMRANETDGLLELTAC
jgi:hypothetical protein